MLILLVLNGAVLGLYENDPHVVKLSVATFDIATRDQADGSAYAVEFFASWCGHCQAFAPHWSAMAANACAAAPTLQLAAIDCVAEAAVCRKQMIRSFPTIKLFVPGGMPLGQPLAKCLHGCRVQRDMLGAILSAVSSLPQPLPQAPPPSAKGRLLHRLVAQGAEPIINQSAACAIHLPPSVAASRQQQQLVQQQQGQQAQLLGYASTLRPGEAPAEQTLRPLPMDDVAAAALYGFRHELYAVAVPAGSARQLAVERWLSLLATALPGASRRAALARLATQARGVSTPVGWQSFAMQPPLAMALLPQPGLASWLGRGVPRWVACRGWSPESRGYPCGLWSLFHTLLAHTNDSASALLAIEGYVEHFFGCAECAGHFRGMVRSTSDPPPDGVHGPIGSPSAAALWLWRAHNAVNSRLNRSTEAAVLTLGLRKMQWPDAATCPSCRDHAGHWRRGAVLRHLRASYCRETLAPCARASDAAEGASASGAEVATLVQTADGRRAMVHKAGRKGGEGGGGGDLGWVWSTAGHAIVLAALLAYGFSRSCSRRLRASTASPRLEELTPINAVADCAYHQLRPSRD